jgi:hypothetical protein
VRIISRRAALAFILAAGMVAAVAGAAGAPGAAAAQAAGAKVVLSAGQTGTLAQVPWPKVGPGWELVQYDASTHARPGALTLYLVDPAGGRYRMYRWAAKAAVRPTLADWSGDKARALFALGANTVEQLNMVTGKMEAIRLQYASFAIGAGYTRPSGSRLLITDGASRGVTLYSLRGTVVGRLGSNSAGAIPSADGTQFVLPGPAGLKLNTSAGRLIRSLPVRGAGCSPLRYWDATTILATCAVARTAAQSRLWLVPASGRAPRALTSARLTPPDLGNLGAWRLRSGLYLQAAGSCGSLFIARQHGNGATNVVNVPGTNGTRNQVITADGRRLLVAAGTGCMSSNSLLWFSPATHAEQWLIRTPGSAYGVTAVVPFYSREYQASI